MVGWEEDWITTARKIVHDEFEWTYANLKVDESEPEEPSMVRFFILWFMEIWSESLSLKELPLNTKARNRFANLPSISISKSTTISDKLRWYLAAPPEEADNPFAWWIKNRHQYPHLSRIALTYLSIPGEFRQYLLIWANILYLLATSVDVEQVFSKGRLILLHIRNCLSVESTCALMCLGYWSRLGYVEDSDIHAAAILPNVMEKDVDDEEDMW